MQEVGAFEAKAVARLVPPQRAFNRDQAGAAIKRTRKRAENAEARALRVGRMEILPGRRPAVSLVIDSSAALERQLTGVMMMPVNWQAQCSVAASQRFCSAVTR